MAARSATDPSLTRRGRAGRALARAVLLAAALGAPAAHATPARTVAAHAWMGVSTPHVDVITDAGREVGERVAQQLEDLRTVLSRFAPALVVDVAPVQVIVFRDADLARSYAPTWHGQLDEVAGFFQTAPDRRRLLFQDDPSHLPGVARHEYTHALLDAAMPEAPLWLNEGLAEYFSTFTAANDRAEAGAPVQAHLDWLAHHELMPLSELFAVRQTSAVYHEGDRRGTFYAESWALTHMILSGTEDDLGRLERVLVATRGGQRFAAAFADVFGDDRTLQDRLAATLERPHLEAREWWLRSPLRARPPSVRERVPPAEVLGSLGTALLARAAPQLAEAEAHLGEALELDPHEPGACAGMGWLELQRGRHAQANAWFEQALASEPVSVPAVRIMASQLLLDVGERTSAEERQSVSARVRAALARALALAPEDPELEALLARSWVVSPGDDPAPGWEPIVRATAALPGRMDLLLDRLALAALIGRDAEAWQLFATYFRDADHPELTRAAREALLVGDVRAANRLLVHGDMAGAEARLRDARGRLGDDPEVAAEADRYLAQLREAQANHRMTASENRAIDEYNAGVRAANAAQYADAAAAFRRAAAAANREALRRLALQKALSMDLRARGERAVALARAGDVAQALALFQAMDRTSMSDEDRRWLDRNVTQLKRTGGR
jgi:hypothetical protein